MPLEGAGETTKSSFFLHAVYSSGGPSVIIRTKRIPEDGFSRKVLGKPGERAVFREVRRRESEGMPVAFSVLVLSPGARSTRVAAFCEDVLLWEEELFHEEHTPACLGGLGTQAEARCEILERLLEERPSGGGAFDAVVGRGGVVAPVPGGFYAVDEALVRHLLRDHPQGHVSNLGGLLARALALPRGLPALMGDPVSAEERDPVARLSGLPELPRKALAHTLSLKAVVRAAARELEKPWEELRVVAVHLGNGISACAHRDGRMVDLTNPNDAGPFSLDQAGGVPSGDLVRLCFSGAYTLQDVRTALVGAGGVMGYLGTDDLASVHARRKAGDGDAERVFSAMAYQVGEEIGALAAALAGRVDAVLLTGPLAGDPFLVQRVREWVQWIAPVLVFAGGNELGFLAEGARRVLSGEEPAKRYGDYVVTGEE